MTYRYADFSISEDQQMIIDVFRSFYQKEVPTTRVRDAEPHGFDEDLWRRLVDMCVDGIMTSQPTALERVLRKKRVPAECR